MYVRPPLVGHCCCVAVVVVVFTFHTDPTVADAIQSNETAACAHTPVDRTTYTCVHIFYLPLRLRQKKIEELKKLQRSASPANKVGGVLSALGRKLNKLTAQEDPELATEDHIAIEEDEDDEEEVGEGGVLLLLITIVVVVVICFCRWCCCWCCYCFCCCCQCCKLP